MGSGGRTAAAHDPRFNIGLQPTRGSRSEGRATLAGVG